MPSVTQPLPEPSSEVPVPAGNTALIRLETLPPERLEQARALATKLDVADAYGVIAFGASAQSEVTSAADQMLQHAVGKDVGPVGEALGDMMLKVQGLNIENLRPGEEPSRILAAIYGAAGPIMRFVQRYERVNHQIETIVQGLEEHKIILVKDMTLLDRLFAATLECLHRLELYIAATQLKLQEMDRVTLPALQARAEETGDMLDAQALHDMTSQRDDLERRAHDLLLTRMITLQSLPQIRLIQEVDSSLLSKIQSSVMNTIPLWKQQIAMAITLYNQRKAALVVQKVIDTTGRMIRRNAQQLQETSALARREAERGIADIEAIREANERLVATIQEGLQIAEDGRRKRAEARGEMQRLEGQLKEALVQARASRDRLATDDA